VDCADQFDVAAELRHCVQIRGRLLLAEFGEDVSAFSVIRPSRWTVLPQASIGRPGIALANFHGHVAAMPTCGEGGTAMPRWRTAYCFADVVLF
jgi:hypothetical protein